jgi:hypothetical protein
VTRDIDLLVHRDDLEKIVAAAEIAGYAGERVMGGYMLIRHGQEPEEAVHLLFVGEKPRSTHPLPNPAIDPEEKRLPQFGMSIPSCTPSRSGADETEFVSSQGRNTFGDIGQVQADYIEYRE